MAMYTTTRPTTTPLSTKLAVLVGLLLVGVGIAWAINDELHTAAPQTDAALPANALPGTLPNFDHVIQYASLLVIAVGVAGFLVTARAILKMR